MSPPRRRWRVDAMPWWMRPVVLLYGGVAGSLLWIVVMLLRGTIRVRVVGREHLPPASNGIYCFWHDGVPLFLVCAWPRACSLLPPGPLAWLQHPLVHMKPIHVLLRMLGVGRMVLGSSGHGGRAGAEAMTALLRGGASAVVQPDGPHGPPRALKPGVLRLASRSGVLVVPMRLEATRAWRLPSWDRSRFPIPGSTITLTFGYPCRVSGEDDTAARDRIVAALG